jgi:hypothetical protein
MTALRFGSCSRHGRSKDQHDRIKEKPASSINFHLANGAVVVPIVPGSSLSWRRVWRKPDRANGGWPEA